MYTSLWLLEKINVKKKKKPNLLSVVADTKEVPFPLPND
jgi:hypothetical protein